MLGVIGGTGLYKLDELEILENKKLDTPFGAPSDSVVIGKLGKQKLAFLPRHGSGHALTPTEVPYRANIFALKSLGVRQILSVSATGSLQEEIAPGELALVSQYIDMTKKREMSFFGNGMVAHVSSAETSSRVLTKELLKAAEVADEKLHANKTYLCVEGPRLGTRAESFAWRKWGADLVGMTNCPESFLALEAQIPYVTMAVATDYDCWKEDDVVNVEVVMKRYGESIGKVKKILLQLCEQEWNIEDDPNRKALAVALMTPESALSSQNKEILNTLRL